MFLPVQYYAITGLLNLFTSIVLGVFIVWNSVHLKTNRIYAYFCFSISFWSIFYYLFLSSNIKPLAEYYLRTCMFGVVFMPSLFIHFTISFLNIDKSRFFLPINYTLSVLFALSVYTNLYALNSEKYLVFDYWLRPGVIFHLFIIHFTSIFFYAFYLLWNRLKSATGLFRSQLIYVYWGIIIGLLSGSTNYFVWYRIPIPPFLNIFVSLYMLMICYGMIRYRLLDISIVITRTSIFITVYSLVLGLPFALAFGWREELISLFGQNWWTVPLGSSTVLATAGPFIYLYFQKKAEDRLLQEQRQYQATLRQASMGMGQVKDIKRLLNLIVHIITRTVWIAHCEIYLLHEESKQFILKVSRGWELQGSPQASVIPSDSLLVSHLRDLKESVVYEEISQYAEDYKNALFNEIKEIIRRLDGALVVPSFIDQKLIAILVLGKKMSGKLYTQDDLAVFTILANQAALAIENAQFYEKMKETHNQLIRAEKMATVGTMADGLSHQINNRLHAMGFIAGDALDTINLKKKENLSPDLQSFLDELAGSLNRIEDNVRRGGEIVQGLLKYTRKGSELFEAIDLNALIDAAIEMVKFKIKLEEINFTRSFAENLPKIKGNFTQLQEVFFNIIDNSYDAMMQRKTEMKEEGFQPILQIAAQEKEHKIEILIRDNGIGVKLEDVDKLFTPFFTTKLSSKKGTGLGLYVMRQIIEENHGGKVEFTSEYRNGSQICILLPAAEAAEEIK